MEFGFEPVCDQLRAVQAISTWFEAGCGPVADLLAHASSLLAS